jgi:hypothetical protein
MFTVALEGFMIQEPLSTVGTLEGFFLEAF